MPQPCQVSLSAPIQAVSREYMESYARGDAADVARQYTHSGQLLPAHSGIVSGREAIQAYWQGTMDLGIRSISLESTEAEYLGETSFDVGRYTLFGGKGQVLDSGKYLLIWKIEDGHWHLHRYIWTTSMRAPGPSMGTD